MERICKRINKILVIVEQKSYNILHFEYGTNINLTFE